MKVQFSLSVLFIRSRDVLQIEISKYELQPTKNIYNYILLDNYDKAVAEIG